MKSICTLMVPTNRRLAKASLRLRNDWSTLVVLLVMGVCMLGCSEQSSEQATSSHPWIDPPEAIDEQAVTLSEWLVYRVADSIRAEAVAELGIEPVVQISPKLASYLAQTEVRVPDEMRPFLIRGVASPEAAITVIQFATGLWTKSSNNVLSALDYQPLVVFVDPTPLHVFVTAE
jgi:hypothetical protein